MDFITTRPIEITSLALNGLSERHKTLIANVANTETPGYKRTDVTFEDQLRNILDNDNKQKLNRGAGLTYNQNVLMSDNMDIEDNIDSGFKDFNPEIISHDSVSAKPDGNNVNIEFEMAELAKNGTKYTAITTMQEKMFRGLSDVIKGGGSI